VRSKGADRPLAERLEQLAVKTADHDALSTAHDLLTRELAGAERAGELVRQAELRVKAGMPPHEAIQHGEAGLTSVAPGDAEPLLERLAALALRPSEVVDLYERQVSRSKAPADRVKALGRAAQVAAARGQLDRARAFFDLALSGAPTEDTLGSLSRPRPRATAPRAARGSGGLWRPRWERAARERATADDPEARSCAAPRASRRKTSAISTRRSRGSATR
jgi:hypothetical protein